jgi:hypothetical protein
MKEYYKNQIKELKERIKIDKKCIKIIERKIAFKEESPYCTEKWTRSYRKSLRLLQEHRIRLERLIKRLEKKIRTSNDRDERGAKKSS